MIRHISYNEMMCDTCGATRRVWEGRPLDGWLIREEGSPAVGYHPCHYCPTCWPKEPA